MSAAARVRLAGAILGVLMVGIVAASLPAAAAALQTACAEPCGLGQLTPGALAALAALGVAPAAYATAYLVFSGATTLVWWGVAAILIWRKPDDGMARLVALTLLLQGANGLTELLLNAQPALLILNSLGWTALMFMLYLFPDGHFAPRGLRWVALVALLLSLLAVPQNLWPTLPFGVITAPGMVWPIFLAPLLGSQIYRYRYVSTPAQQQQTKWVLFGVVAFVLGVLALLLAMTLVPALSAPGSLYSLIVVLAVPLCALAIPVSIGVAILRSHLWDIDALVNRALVYGALTAALALAYIAGVAALQALLEPLTGGPHSDVAVVGSTLAIAALFSPLRRGFQRLIDRRFYRRKYDASRILTRFAADLREEVDLQTLVARLVDVVGDTMQPAQVSLWLAAPTPGPPPVDTAPWRDGPERPSLRRGARERAARW